jgi:hypothetical protein
MEKGPGDPNRPSPAYSPRPVKTLFRIGTPLPLSHPLTSRSHSSESSSPQSSPLSSLETVADELLPSPIKISINCLPVSSPHHAYKSPPASSPFPPLSLCRSCRQAAQISRRSFARLRASPHQFGTHGEPRAPSPLLTFLLHPNAPADALLLLYLAVNRASRRPPSRYGNSSRSLMSPREAHVITDQDFEPFVTFYFSSATPSPPETLGARRSSTTSAPHRNYSPEP